MHQCGMVEGRSGWGHGQVFLVASRARVVEMVDWWGAGSVGVLAVVGMRRVRARRCADIFAMGWAWMFDGVVFGRCFWRMDYGGGSSVSVVKILSSGVLFVLDSCRV